MWNILTTMQTTLSLFKFLTNFILGEFEKLAQLVVLTNVGQFSRANWKLARFSSWFLTNIGSNASNASYLWFLVGFRFPLLSFAFHFWLLIGFCFSLLSFVSCLWFLIDYCFYLLFLIFHSSFASCLCFSIFISSSA